MCYKYDTGHVKETDHQKSYGVKKYNKSSLPRKKAKKTMLVIQDLRKKKMCIFMSYTIRG